MRSDRGRSDWSMPVDDVATVLRFLPVFEDPSFVHGVERGGAPDSSGVIEWPWFEYAPEVLEFEQTLYHLGWILRFDWPAWQEEGAALVRGDGVESADLETLKRLLTLLVRKERFREGTLAAAFDEGLVLRILRRVAELEGAE